MAFETKTKAPAAPSHLPKSVQDKWKQTFVKTYDDAAAENPELPADRHHATALKAANKLSRVEEPANYDEAKKLVDAREAGDEDGWKIIAHGKRVIDGKDHLYLVTANGKKHFFPVPAGSSLDARLQGLTVPQLLDFAAEKKITVTATKKADVIAEIEAALAGK